MHSPDDGRCVDVVEWLVPGIPKPLQQRARPAGATRWATYTSTLHGIWQPDGSEQTLVLEDDQRKPLVLARMGHVQRLEELSMIPNVLVFGGTATDNTFPDSIVRYQITALVDGAFRTLLSANMGYRESATGLTPPGSFHVWNEAKKTLEPGRARPITLKSPRPKGP